MPRPYPETYASLVKIFKEQVQRCLDLKHNAFLGAICWIDYRLVPDCGIPDRSG